MKPIMSIVSSLLMMIFLATSCTEDNLMIDSVNADHNLHSHESSNQTTHRNCGLSHKMEQLLLDPEYKKIHEAKFRNLKLVGDDIKFRSNCSTPVVIPTAVHYQSISGPNESCLKSLAQTQIDILNKDFTGTNSDINKWTSSAASYFPNASNGEACVKFVLANKNHPSGYGLSEGTPAITINKTNGDQLNAFSKYLNIYVRPNLGFLGESPLGGRGNGDGVLVDANAFGAGNGCGSVSPDAPYNLGRTLTHEIGHYLLLDHIWGDGCNVDDDVNDTPNQNSDYGGCPSLGASSCGTTDMHMNYMDYTNDECMYMFSSGQAARMESYLASSLTNITSNAQNVYDGAGNPNPPIDDEEDPTDGNDDNSDDDNSNGDDNDDSSDEDNNDNDDNSDDDEVAQICDTPKNLSFEIINDTKVKITWDESYDPIRYQVRYRRVGTTRWTRKSRRVNTLNISNLVAGDVYEYQVRTSCPTGWTTYSSKSQFNTITSDSDNGGETATCNTIKFELVLDDYGSETSWELVDENLNTIAKGGPYQDGQGGKKITKSFCLEDGCYTMYVDDQYGDGICCDYGDGYFQIKDEGGQIIGESNGYFGNYDYLDICVEGNSGSLRSRKTDPKTKKLARKKSLATN